MKILFNLFQDVQADLYKKTNECSFVRDGLLLVIEDAADAINISGVFFGDLFVTKVH